MVRWVYQSSLSKYPLTADIGINYNGKMSIRARRICRRTHIDGPNALA